MIESRHMPGFIAEYLTHTIRLFQFSNTACFLICIKLTEEVYTLRDEREELRKELSARDQAIKELSQLMGLAHISPRQHDGAAINVNDAAALL